LDIHQLKKATAFCCNRPPIVEDRTDLLLCKSTRLLKVNFQFQIVIDRGKEQQSTSAHMTHSKVVGKVQQFSRSIERY
jgi:hypothetical protein